MSEPTSYDPSDAAFRETSPLAPAPVPAASRAGWIAPAALAISLLAAGAAAFAVFKPAPAPLSSGVTSDDPKAAVCKTFKTVSDAVYLQTNRSPGPDMGPLGPVAAEAIAANARLAMAGGANYLLDNLPANAPADLADEVRGFAGSLNTIAMNALAGISNDKPEQADLLRSAEDANKKLIEHCK